MIKPYNPDVIEKAAFAVLNEGAVACGIVLAFAHQSNAQLVPPFATLSIDSRTPQGQPDRIHLDDTGIMALYAQRIGGGTILCTGDTAGDMADRLVNWLTTTSASYAFRRAGLVVHSVQPVPMQPFEMDGQNWQQATAVDFQYRCGVVYDDNVGLIQVVNVNNKVNEVDGELWLAVQVPPTPPLPSGEYMTIDTFVPQPVGHYPIPHHTVHTNQAVISYAMSSDNPDFVDLIDDNGQKLNLKKAGAAMLTIVATLADGTELPAKTVIGCTG